jgi:polysaccharide biosynthesis/export protein
MIRKGMIEIGLVGAITLLCVGTLPTHADDKSGQTAAETSPTSPAPYVLAGDDVICINVVNFPNLSQPLVPIPPDGKLSVQLLESFSVLGKTTGEVAQMLTDKWQRYVIKPSVSVTLVQKRRDSVLVYGLVARPGTADFKPPMRLLEAIAQVGGPLTTADLIHVAITHKNGTKLTLDLSHPETRGGTANDVMLEVGDVVYIPERHTEVSVVGEVLRPGPVDYRDDLTVEDAVVAAGGIKDMTADLAGATLTHDGKETKLDLDALYRHADGRYNVKLAPGDRLLIPEVHNRTYVIGAVARPGFYNFKPGDTVLDALNNTGGATTEANLTKINLVHVAPDKKSAKVTDINLEKFLKKGDMKANVALTAGDVLFVPEKRKSTTSSDLWGALSGFNIVSGIVNLVR